MAEGGLKQIFLVVRPALTRFLVARGLSAEDAQDTLQDLYLKLDEDRIGAVADPRAYLYRMADNLMLDRRRSAGRRLRRETQWSGGSGLTEIDPQPSAETQLIDRERLARVTQALAALPPRSADIFRRFRLLGEPQRDIAAALGISLSAVEKHLQRAYAAVLAARGELDGDGEPPRRRAVGGDSHVA